MRFLKDVSLADKNTFRAGGPAAYYCEPGDESQLIEALHQASEIGLPVWILGNGSNLLMSDQGWPGLVINLSAELTKVNWSENGVEAGSGTQLNIIVNQSVSSGIAGMEELAGIPGTVGGAVIMNAGAFRSCIADTLHLVRYFDLEEDRIICAKASELQLGYRSCNLRNKPAVILSAAFHFSDRKAPEELSQIRRDILSKRKAKQPLEYPNCGSVFKRPPGNYAGTLIEQSGLKGMRVGDMEVSIKHANFIVNRGQGTATDARRLIIKLQKAVYENSGILLEPEVIFAGQFADPLYVPS
ncbi:MAG: UDP-N-acetylmuramate dehydrogenase [Fibrobacter sp.]|nr:UDP-N-acetylmuramate dehydrogenase [Fibrobacter sp.]